LSSRALGLALLTLIELVFALGLRSHSLGVASRTELHTRQYLSFHEVRVETQCLTDAYCSPTAVSARILWREQQQHLTNQQLPQL
jgi:hypothetical protein